MNDFLDFSVALSMLKEGLKMRRMHWKNVKFVYLVPGSRFNVNRPPLLGVLPVGTEVDYQPHLDAQYADGSFGVWSISMGDVLANDWVVVE